MLARGVYLTDARRRIYFIRDCTVLWALFISLMGYFGLHLSKTKTTIG
jgi:hypothetical protein